MTTIRQAPYVGQLFRLGGEVSFEDVLLKVEKSFHGKTKLVEINDSEWQELWLVPEPNHRSGPRDPQLDRLMFNTPFLVKGHRRADQKRADVGSVEKIVLLALHDEFVEWLLDAGGVIGRTIPPRIHVDRLARDLVAPSTAVTEKIGGRPYLMGAVWAAIEGNGDALRSVVLYGNDLADARLFQQLLKRINVHRVGVRHLTGKEILGISGVGQVSLQSHRGLRHLQMIDELLTFLEGSGYIDWRYVERR
jgi:hypothetical protein